MKRHARNLRDIRHAVHGSGGDVRNLSGEYIDLASRRVMICVNGRAVNEIPVHDEQSAMEKLPRFYEDS